MKLLRIPALLLALAGAALSTTPRARAALSYNNGDLFLGFRASAGVGSTQDLLVNIGSAAQFSAGTGSTVVGNIGNLSADLTATFGADWSAREDLFWSVSGANLAADPANTLYATRARVNPSTQTQPWLGRSNSSQGVTVSKFNGLIGAYLISTPSLSNSAATIQNASDTNSYASYQPGGTTINSAGISFAAFSPTIEASFVNGTAGSVVDLYRIVPVFEQPAQLLGNLRLDSDGAVIFTAPAATVLSRVRIEQAAYSISEADASGQLSLKVIRSVGTGAISVNLSAIDGTAVAGTDFTAPGVPVDFADGQTEATVNIPIVSRAGFQGNRNFTVAIGTPSAGVALRTPTSATVTILESEVNTAGSIAFSAVAFNVSSTAAGGSPSNIAVQLTRANGSTGSVSVDVSVSGGTLVDGTDFESVANPTTVTFAAGETSKSLTIQLKPIAAEKLPGTILLALANPTNNAVLGAQTTAAVNVSEGIRSLVAGVYSGILSPAAGASIAPGFVTIKVSGSGTFSGKVTLGKASLPITGTIGADGIAKFNPSKGGSVALSSKGQPLGTLALKLNGDVLTGTLQSGSNTVIASVQTGRAYFDGKTPATTVAANYLRNKGTYTAVLPARDSQAGLTATDYPHGDGFALVKLSPKGVVTLKGRLADGTVLSVSGSLRQDYSLQLFGALYAKLGSISGALQFDDSQSESDLSGTDLRWVKPADAKARYYPSGWPQGIVVDLLGASYAVPAKNVASVIPGLPAPDPQNGNAALLFSAGKLAADVGKNVNIDTANKALSAPAGDTSFSLKINAKTAQIGGKFTHSDGTKPAFQGIVYQKGAAAGAYGYFLSTVPKGGASGEGGRVSLTAKE